METPLALIYTGGIRGDLRLLPRLHTFIQRLRQDYQHPTILLDIGRSCVPDVWPCGVTQGRSTIIALDAMGFDIVNASDVLTPPSRMRLVEQVSLAVLLPGERRVMRGLAFGIGTLADGDTQAKADLMPADQTAWHDGVLRLADVHAGEVGVVLLDGGILQASIHTMPNDTPPNPTIAGTIDFIESEARYFEKRHDAEP